MRLSVAVLVGVEAASGFRAASRFASTSTSTSRHRRPTARHQQRISTEEDQRSAVVALDDDDDDDDDDGVRLEASDILATSASLRRREEQSSSYDFLRRKLWTKLDKGHTHAISGALFLVAGAGWLACAAAVQLDGLPAPSAGAPIWGARASLAILAIGVWNGLSALPMSTAERVYVSKDMDRYHALAFRWGGTAQLVACAWLCFWFSGIYPSFQFQGAFDGALSLAAIGSICWVVYFSEESITSLNRKVEDGGWVHGRRAKELEPSEVTQLSALARLGSYPNLFQLPVLVNVLIGGRPWFDQVAVLYPAQHALLHHYLFACSISYAITFFATTLRDRNLISIAQDLTMLATGTAVPFLTMFLDTHCYPTATTLNPFDYNVGFI